MRILVVFIDMVRVDQLNLFNPTKSETAFDIVLRNIGGTLFTRCYTPGPDTPRSNACMQTGLYPYFNGCDTRIKWPRYFIKDDITTIFDHASAQGYRINACIRQHTLETGLLKYGDDTHINFYVDYMDFVKNAAITENSLSFVYDPDWHTALSDYHAIRFGFKEGNRLVSKLFENYLTNDYTNQFDYVIVYSDHGCQFQDECNHLKSKLELLYGGRTQQLLLVHKKGDVGVRKDQRLAAMMDLYATMEDLIGCSDFRQGYSLLDEPKRKILHIEDHQDFGVYPEVMIKQWRVISDHYDIRTDGIQYTCDVNSDTFKEVDKHLRKYSPKYGEYVKQLEVWRHYDTLSNNTSPYYVVGEKRGNKYLLFINRAYQKIKSVFLGWLKRNL